MTDSKAGHGWLPFWTAQREEPGGRSRQPCLRSRAASWEYVTGGRYFHGIEIPEGAPLTSAVADPFGEDVLMYASKYPHAENYFLDSAGRVLAPATAQPREG